MPTAGRYIPDPIAFDILPVRIEFGELPFRLPERDEKLDEVSAALRCAGPTAGPQARFAYSSS